MLTGQPVCPSDYLEIIMQPRQTVLSFACVLLWLQPALAQQHPHTGYARQEQRTIKALSAGEIRQYAAGAGMGYARAAELNHYPGPMHVLELADALELTTEQRTTTQQLMDRHKTEARAIGLQLIAAEEALDRLFAAGKVTAETLAQLVMKIAGLQGEYRLSHLETHRRMQMLLTRHQTMQYDRLRGYVSTGAIQSTPDAHPTHTDTKT